MSEPIRVLHVVGTMDRGGVEVMLMNLYREMDRDQVQFDFLCHNSLKGDFSEEIASLGGRMFMIPGASHGGIFKYRRNLYTFFKSHPEYRIIHCHKSDMNGFILEQAAKAGVPYRISHAHTSDPRYSLRDYPFAMWSKRLIDKNLTHAFACSHNAAEYVYRDPVHQRDATIIYNGINTESFRFDEQARRTIRERYQIPEDAFVIGHVGKFTKFKNQSFLVDVLEELCRDTDARLLLIGAGDMQWQVQEKATEKGLSDKVILVGVQSAIPDFMSAMDAFVFPSIYEGLPVVTVEAQASGLPIFLSDTLTKEIAISDLVYYVPLSETARHWADVIRQYAYDKDRSSYADVVADTPYNSRYAAKELQEFYISLS